MSFFFELPTSYFDDSDNFVVSFSVGRSGNFWIRDDTQAF